MFCCCSEENKEELVVVPVQNAATGLPPDYEPSTPAKEEPTKAEVAPPPPEPKVDSPPAEKAAAASPQSPRAGEGELFEITVEKANGDKLGLDTKARKAPAPALKITQVKTGLVQKWNEANPDKVVTDNDLILSVYDVSQGQVADTSQRNASTEVMYNIIAKSTKITMLIQRRPAGPAA
mmetsp:Transcript_36039/g.90607  ORF Transcript_36039/g.90607 Transcript_36039/m.90607 type:complete len:179 (+) Transcript_36039:85-621(+)